MAQPGKVVPQDPVDRPSPGADPFPDASNPLPPDAFPVTVEGLRVAPPDDGFGKLWHKRFRIHLTGANVTPAAAIDTWRERFGQFWPQGNRIYRPLAGLKPGEVVLMDLAMPLGTRLSTGVVVVESTGTSFTYSTAPGHLFAGRITFSAYDRGGVTVAQIEMWLRASDPLFEISLPLGGHTRDDRFWQATLQNLATHFGVVAEPETFTECVDPHRRWRNWVNVRRNSYIRTGLHLITIPFRWLVDRLARKSQQR